MSRPIRDALVFALVILTTVSWLNAQVELSSQRVALSRGPQDALKLPSGSTISALALNNRTFAADIAWVGTIIDNGEFGAQGQITPHLMHNARVISEVDPDFYAVYEWTPGAFLSRRSSATEEELNELNALMDRGIARFPKDSDLAFSAALHYVGYSTDGSPERRERELDKALNYLERAARGESPPETLPFVYAWFAHRKLRYSNEMTPELVRESEIEFNLELYRNAPDPDLRAVARANLELLQASDERMLEVLVDEERKLMTERSNATPYLNTNLWLLLYEEG